MAAHAAAEQRPDAWLSSILSSGQQHQSFCCAGPLELHKVQPILLHIRTPCAPGRASSSANWCAFCCPPVQRLVHLASLRESVLQRLGQLDAVKVALTERKATQQGRLLAALDARLSAAQAAVDPHRYWQDALRTRRTQAPAQQSSSTRAAFWPA